MEIRFYGHPDWVLKGREREIAERIALIVYGEKDLWESTNRGGYRFQLGNGNDWKVDRDLRTGEWIVYYRYGTPEKMQALRITLLFLLGIEQFNNDMEMCENFEYIIVMTSSGVRGTKKTTEAVCATLDEAEARLRQVALEQATHGLRVERVTRYKVALLDLSTMLPWAYLSIGSRPKAITVPVDTIPTPPDTDEKAPTRRTRK